MQIKKTRTILFVILLLILAACTPQSPPEDSLVGTLAPNFELDNTLGGKTALSDYSGTPVLLFFHMAVG
ncbi:MAG: redoxin domain-containing protein [Anaerolineae bacterium]|jgi:cytochrome oxidase Cu insertion factor (SCO1/SenC/PrrC family)|nr:redoxin domain-containing protein [Anaerolineae bacterium]MBT3713317.1 redoxin domain-containing protein [Anaerolineae bacterium]MBT4310713.1 redoxin domain-containing protein [Anaerolineae bacterium]MBT4457889.1 redoxin domain-containing protein [Anaerolineae bacterium]MBT4842078.1 redoxin domain-containing protein [Anaerolineae bacterium]